MSDIQLLRKAFVYITNCNSPYTVTGRDLWSWILKYIYIYANDLWGDLFTPRQFDTAKSKSKSTPILAYSSKLYAGYIRRNILTFQYGYEVSRITSSCCGTSMAPSSWSCLKGHTNDHEWPRMTTNDHEWPRMTTNDHEWPRLTTSDHDWPRMTHEYYFYVSCNKKYLYTEHI